MSTFLVGNKFKSRTNNTKEPLTGEELKELEELFNYIDKDGEGNIDVREFSELLHAMSIHPPPHEVNAIFDMIDTDGGGSIDFEEFVAFMQMGAVDIKHLPRELLMENFKVIAESHALKARSPYIISKAQFITDLLNYVPDKVIDYDTCVELLQHIPGEMGSTDLFDYQKYMNANTVCTTQRANLLTKLNVEQAKAERERALSEAKEQGNEDREEKDGKALNPPSRPTTSSANSRPTTSSSSTSSRPGTSKSTSRSSKDGDLSNRTDLSQVKLTDVLPQTNAQGTNASRKGPHHRRNKSSAGSTGSGSLMGKSLSGVREEDNDSNISNVAHGKLRVDA